MTRSLVRLGLLALLLGTPLAALAQTADDARAQAQALLDEGVGLLGKKNFDGALDCFQRAYAIFPSPNVLVNIASSLKELGRTAEAANAYQKYLDDPGAKAARRVEIGKILAELDKTLGTLVISVEPAGALVQVEGWEPGWLVPAAEAAWLPAAQAMRWRVLPGPFSVRARKDGFTPGEERGAVDAQGRATAAIVLIAEVAPEPVEAAAELAPETASVVAPAERTDDARAPRPPARSLRLGAIVDVAIDGRGEGAAVSPGLSLRLADRFELVGKALVSASKGGYLGASVYLTRSRVRPSIGIGIPIFYSGGARVGIRGAAGVTFELADRLSVVAEVGAEKFFNPEMDRVAFVVVPVLGIHARL